MKRRITILFILAAGLTLFQCRYYTREPLAPAPLLDANRSVIRVNVTRQRYDFHMPWQQQRPSNRSAIGVVMPGGTILVTAQPLANSRYIEVEKLDTQEKSRAEVVVVDYEANLALLKATKDDFLADRTPLEITTGAGQGDLLEVWRIKPNGDVVADTGTLVSVELAAYPYENAFLAFKLSSAVQYRFSYATLPVIKNGRLAGFLMRYDTHTQTIDVIPEPVIRHFIADAGDGQYNGFPTAGFGISPLTDPQLRRFETIPEAIEGIYVQNVLKGGPADRAGLTEGDVITRIGEEAIDPYGRYRHSNYGRISVQHLIRCGYQVGETLTMDIFRKGRTQKIALTLNHRKPDDYLVPRYVIDRPPRYMIIGGLVFQELTADYLQEYGSDWAAKAPIHLINYHLDQNYPDPEEREKIVFLSSVIPTAETIGFEYLTDLVVTQVNQQKIRRLEDVADALKSPLDGFHRIAFEQHPKVIFLDPGKLESVNQEILERYGIAKNFQL